MIFAFAMAAITLAITALLAAVPRFATLPLGVSVPQAKRNDATVTSALNSYRRWVWAAGILGILLCLAGPIPAALSSALVTFGGIAAYVIQRRHIIAAKQAGGWYDDVETAISARITPTVERPTFPWIWFLGSVLAVTVSVLVVARGWSAIPDPIPTHWGSDMQPDAWGAKSVGNVFMASFINVGLIALFAFIAWIITTSSVHARSDRSIKGQVRNAAVMAATNQALGILMFLLVAALAFMQVTSTLPQYSGWQTTAFIVVVGATVVGVIALAVLVFGAQKRADEQLRGVDFPDSSSDSPDNDHHYAWGMFYYNPDDPAVMVDKRFGVGMDFNYATWQAKAFMVFVALVVVGSIALPLLLS